jgi:flagellar P-ring protein precursor FlgI
MKNYIPILLMALTAIGVAQTAPPTNQEDEKARQARLQQRIDQDKAISDALLEGISVRLPDIGGFRGAQSNVVMGYGLVVGLDGTGDTKSTPFTAKLLSNALSRWGTMVDPEQMRGKNIATVSVTAELPPFAAPGRKVDITIQSIGDAKSLAGGFLLPTPLAPTSKPDDVYILATGAASIGGFSASSGGASSSKNHQNVGRIPDGGDVQKSVQTQFVFPNNTVYFDLDEPDFTTAQRTAQAIVDGLPGYLAIATDAVTIKIIFPAGVDPVVAFSQVESIEVKANLPTSVVINERTGTIVIGGNVKLGPAVIAHGSLQVRIESEVFVSQPPPFSNGETKVVEIPVVETQENPAQIGLIGGKTTLNDLAKILQALKVTARDIIAIIQALADQGALKARVKIQ